jgi:23S rRNA A1618 N6-methylase RlmF
MRQYLLDFETGKVLDFNKQSVQVILMQDPELYDEFMKVKKRQQNDLLFFFMRRFNEKYPVTIPVR